jgi:hypothetical protein
MIWAQVRETINPVTGLKQQARKTFASQQWTYIFSCVPVSHAR